MSIRILVVRVDHTASLEQWDGALSSLYQLLGVTSVELSCDLGVNPPRWYSYCDGEGKLNGSKPNWPADVLAHELGWNASDTLYGNVAFVGPLTDAGDDTSVPEFLVVYARVRGVAVMNKADIACPRSKSQHGPCIVRDGAVALADAPMVCVACGITPRAVVVEFANRGVTGVLMNQAKLIPSKRPEQIRRQADLLGELAISYLEAKQAPGQKT